MVNERGDLVKCYEKQLDLYAEALGQVHMEVVERLMYAFRLDEEVKV